ncbi:MAG: hypothetical protein WCC11_03685 [Gammaproteobacteria bacterium]
MSDFEHRILKLEQKRKPKLPLIVLKAMLERSCRGQSAGVVRERQRNFMLHCTDAELVALAGFPKGYKPTDAELEAVAGVNRE